MILMPSMPFGQITDRDGYWGGKRVFNFLVCWFRRAAFAGLEDGKSV